jgi:peptide/nickel transport system substrate-binding protein
VDVAPLTAPPALVTVVPALESTTRRPISGPAPTPLARPALMPAPAGRPPSRLARRALAALLALAAACDRSGAGPIAGEGGGDVGGTVVIATAAEPATLFPPLAAGSPAAAVVDQVFDRLAEVGDSLGTFGDGGFRPRLASRWAWAPDSLAVTFTLAPGARWHDGRPVTSRDVAFSFAVATDPDVASPSSAFLANVDSISTPDSVTAVAWFKRRLPTQFFDLTYYMYVLPEHLLGRVPRAQLARSPFARRPVGSGRFRLEEWTRGERLVLAADAENYRGRPRLDRAVWSVAPDFGAATIRFLSGEADFFENLRAESVGQLERGEALRALPYPSLDYGFLQFNLRAADGSGGAHRLLADRELRRALTMAIDRERLVRNAVDTLAAVAVGPVPRALAPGWQTLRQLPYNPARARAVLDSLGWAAGPAGARARAGVPLAFTVIVPTSSAVRQQLASLLQGQLRQVGAQVTVERLDLAAFNQRLQGRRFDAAVGGWHSDPNPVGVLQTWGRPGARPGGANFGAYESAAFDAHVDSALAAPDAARSQTQWLRAYQTAVDDAPAVWLFEPRNIAGAHRRLRVAGLRPDAWWARLGEWSIPAGERVGRDRVGLR